MTSTAEAAWRSRTRTPVLLATAVAWVALVELAAFAGPHDAGMPGMPGMPGQPGPGASGPLALGVVALMVAAMMVPLLTPAVRHVASRSLRRRRWRAVPLVVAAHAAVWLAGGLALLLVGGRVLGMLGPMAAPALGVAVALVWHASPSARRCGNQHHARPPLAAFGVAADRDVLRYGAAHAAYCLGACWPLMLLPALCLHHALAVMALCSVWLWAQALENPAHPEWRLWMPARPGRLARGLAAVSLRVPG